MPILTIDGIEVTMTVAEFVEYQRLSKAEPPPTPEPEPRKTRGSSRKRNDAERRRMELQRQGYANVTNLMSTIVFVHSVLEYVVPGSESYDMDGVEGRHGWLLSRESGEVNRLNRYVSVARSLQPGVGEYLWPPAIAAALICIEIDYGVDTAIAAQGALSRRGVITAVVKLHSKAFLKLSEQDRAAGHIRLHRNQQMEVWSGTYDLLVKAVE
ncbi:hypothetical protein SEA_REDWATTLEHOG_181 [Gordonia phage RedWattleHog]|uniref:Uncharacterized protein n=1 Tax=Gordonia phage Stormageddon TaxID=2656541 RepID=A0A649VSZ0_9CAUD|nr:hypothetical protein KHQ86_gp118 [Gordonia phage Stormageddon]QGJ95042.1 hypothetical protein SEA_STORMAGEDDON_182 [Gordonia phage Stormageddon]QLF83684.1 hypothetical protein SEA_REDWATTLEHOG_181 [Gordonia phage RedWattleHog]